MPSDTIAAPKKSLFKRPKWAQQTSAADTTLLDDNQSAETVPTPQLSLFDRSREFDRIVAERERRKKEKSERKLRKEEEEEKVKRRSEGEGEAEVGSSGSNVKRRRVSDKEDEDEWDSTVKEREKERRRGSSPTPAKSRGEGPALVIDLLQSSESEGDDKDEGVPATKRPATTTRPHRTTQDPDATPNNVRAHTISDTEEAAPDIAPSDSESDPEIAELIRNARLKRRLEEAAAQKALRLYSASHTYSTADNPPPEPHDPKIKLFITSPIPGSTPLIVTRRLSQRLQEVHEAWCERQAHIPGFNPSTVFFTYRLRKLYPVTTCRSLGVRLDDQGHIIPDRHDWTNDDDDETGIGREHEGKVHLEAVTAELWQKLKDARRNGRTTSFNRKSHTHTSDDDDDDDDTATPETEQPHQTEPILRITLKAKGFKDVKLKVRPSTTFAKIANAARQRFGDQGSGESARKVVLVFDGEVLEPEGGVVGDTEIEDMDGIEVYFK